MKNTRGKRNSAKSIIKSLIFSGFNPKGFKSKITTIRKLVRDSNSSIVTMQETKCNQVGQINLDGFYTYEHIRSHKEGGGVALCARKELKPTFINDGGDEVEAITVNIHLKDISISVTSAYGPQESDSLEKKTTFWTYLTNEVQRAKDCGNGFILQGDLNCWLGPEIIKGDVRKQNRNGKMFASFMDVNNLTCVNSLEITEGLIARIRNRLGIEEKSIIDFYVVCQRVLPYVTSLKIDNGSNHTLTNYSCAKEGGKAVESDHKPLVMEVKIVFLLKEKKRLRS